MPTTFTHKPRMNPRRRGSHTRRADQLQKSIEWAVTQSGASATGELGPTRVARYIQRIAHDTLCARVLRSGKNRQQRRTKQAAHEAACEQCQRWGWPKYVK